MVMLPPAAPSLVPASLVLVASLVLMALLPSYWTEQPWAFRLMAMGVWLATAATLFRTGNRQLAGSTLFLLPGLVLAFYSVIGALYVEFLGGATPIHDPAAFVAEYTRRAAWPEPQVLLNVQLAYGSSAERLAIQFGLALTAALALLMRLPIKPLPTTVESRPGEIVLVLMTAFVAVLLMHLPSLKDNYWLAQLRFAALPLATFAMALASRLWADGHKRGFALFVLAGVAAWSGLLEQSIKATALTMVACLFLVATARRPPIRRMLASLLAVAFIIMAVVTTVGLMRRSVNLDHIVGTAWNHLVGKAALRQAETMFCLTSAHNVSLVKPSGFDPGYFLAVLIPRAAWPDKPQYLSGADYAVDYCLYPRQHLSSSRHSASITLLGEPLLHGGMAMLIAVALTVTATLTFGAWIGLHRHPVISAAALATTGWLSDFDQLTVIYLGNAAKVTLVIAAAVAVWGLVRVLMKGRAT